MWIQLHYIGCLTLTYVICIQTNRWVYLIIKTGPQNFLDIIPKHISSRWSIHPSFNMWLKGEDIFLYISIHII